MEKETAYQALGEFYDRCMKRPLEIGDIFNHFFGEDMVDLQIPCKRDFVDSICSSCSRLDDSELYHYKEQLKDGAYEYLIGSVTAGMSIGELIEKKPQYAYAFIHTVLYDLLEREHIRNALSVGGVQLLVHFPKVKITNENDNSVDITHLFVKVDISYEGKLRWNFGLNRSEYSLLHISNNYMHSHVEKIPFGDFTDFQSPCLGSGPIRTTTESLVVDYNKDLWALFCVELAKYVTVESLAGSPWHHLENLHFGGSGSSNTLFLEYGNLWLECINYNGVLSDTLNLKKFILEILDADVMKSTLTVNGISPGMDCKELYIKISDLFIAHINNIPATFTSTLTADCLVDYKILTKGVISGNTLTYRADNRSNSVTSYLQYEGKHVCTFKGVDYKVKITNKEDYSPRELPGERYYIGKGLFEYIITIVQLILNYTIYGSSEDIKKSDKIRFVL